MAAASSSTTTAALPNQAASSGARLGGRTLRVTSGAGIVAGSAAGMSAGGGSGADTLTGSGGASITWGGSGGNGGGGGRAATGAHWLPQRAQRTVRPGASWPGTSYSAAQEGQVIRTRQFCGTRPRLATGPQGA